MVERPAAPAGFASGTPASRFTSSHRRDEPASPSPPARRSGYFASSACSRSSESYGCSCIATRSSPRNTKMSPLTGRFYGDSTFWESQRQAGTPNIAEVCAFAAGFFGWQPCRAQARSARSVYTENYARDARLPRSRNTRRLGYSPGAGRDFSFGPAMIRSDSHGAHGRSGDIAEASAQRRGLSFHQIVSSSC